MSEPAATGRRQPEPLLTIKLQVPQARPELVARPRLAAMLKTGLSRKVTLISAPPGFGKTTALTGWLAGAGERVRVGWVSLEPADSHGARFWHYLLAALDQAEPGLARTAQFLLDARPQPPLEAVVDALVNACADLPFHLALVLDDYHVIQSEPTEQAVAYLVEHMPPNLHLYLTARSDPALPLTRLRARGDLVEVRARDLRFTQAEAAAFLEVTMGLRLSPSQTGLLEQRTEGWITGLQLAALSLQGVPDADSFLTAFAGSHQYIVDYLLEEVLQQQPETIQSFLLETALLDRLCGPLCDAVTGRPGSQALLEALEKRNLFVVALDQQRRWYRYHPLFADVLRVRLEHSRPEALPQLHQRACEWHAAQGLHEPAIAHALAAGAFERAAALVAQTATLVYERGESATLRGWLEAMPQELVRTRPELCMLLARACLIEGRLDRGLAYLDTAEQLIGPEDEATPAGLNLLGQSAVLRGNMARIVRDMDRARALTERGLSLLAPGEGVWRAGGLANLALIHHWSGDREQALAVYAEAEAESLAAGDLHGYLRTVSWRAEALVDAGRLREAMDGFEQALSLAAVQGKERLPMTGIAHVGAGRLLAEWNDLEAAERHLVTGLELCEQGGLLDLRWSGGLALAQVKQARGDAAGAATVLRQVEALALSTNIPLAHARIAPYWARHYLAAGATTGAVRLVPLLEQLAAAPFAPSFHAHVAAALTALYAGRPAEAAERAQAVLDRVEAMGLSGAMIEPLAVRALALHALHEAEGALASLTRALAVAEPEGYVRTFVGLGPALIPLLTLVRPRLEARLAGYAGRLLAATGAHIDTDTEGSSLVEPLSEREREVLSLVADGASNEAIAQHLYISLHTAKKHVANILGKLGVSNRTEAVAKAREYRLL